MNYGGWNDFIEVLRFYRQGTTIRTEIVRSSYLKKDVLNFVCFYFDLEPSDFKCYTRRQSHRELWDFLKRLMQLPALEKFVLVGGTNLGLAVRASPERRFRLILQRTLRP